ncbi:MAG: LLM class flavin-dependent oxidoreductase [Gammaproteobacteria bacterium]|nr:LLM class flavin-dependent oxidoreductase [Gammaproteobacteria bacterium]
MKHAMFLATGPHDEMVAWAKKYESAGFDSLWQAELTNSALIPLAAIAPSVGHIKIGSGVVLAFNHSPVMLAFQAMDLDFLSQGKFILGLGVAHQNRNNNWYAGRDEGKPVSQMREYIEVLQLIMDKAPTGGEIDYQGKFYHLHARNFFARSTPQPRSRVPIYIAAVKPRMVALTGELGNGLIGNPLFSPQHVRDLILPALKTGLDKAGRSRSDVEVLGQCFAIIDDDLSTAYRIGAGAMMFSIWARMYDDIFAAHGFSETVGKVRAMQRTPDNDKAVELIPNEMVDAFCAVGPIDRVRAKINAREGLLDTTILAVPNTGTTQEQRDYYRDKILDAFTD